MFVSPFSCLDSCAVFVHTAITLMMFHRIPVVGAVSAFAWQSRLIFHVHAGVQSTTPLP